MFGCLVLNFIFNTLHGTWQAEGSFEFDSPERAAEDLLSFQVWRDDKFSQSCGTRKQLQLET